MSEVAQEPNMKRRCFVHDYKSRSIYLVTLEVAGRKPLLGRICPQGLMPRAPNRRIAGPGAFQEAGVIGEAGQNGALPPLAMGLPGEATFGGERVSASSLSEAELREMNAGLFEPSELGRQVAEEFMKIGEHVAGVKPIIAQAMPDHFHGVLFVTRAIDRSLGSIIAGFKGRCSQIAGQLGLTPEPPNRPAAGQGAAQEAAVSGEAGQNDASPPLATGLPGGAAVRWPARQRAAITRGECLALNAIAAEICGGDAGEIVYYGLT